VKKENRRNFLKTTAAAIPAVLLGSQLNIQASDKQKSEIFETNCNVVVRPEALLRLDDQGAFQSATPWAISTQDRDLLPYLTDKKVRKEINSAKNFKIENDEMVWQSDIDRRLAELRIFGEAPIADVIGDVGSARYEGKGVQINLTVFDQLLRENGLVPITESNNQISTLPYPEIQESIIIPVEAFGYRLQFRGPDMGGLSGCAPEAPKHYQIELFRKRSNGSFEYVANYHIAIWRMSGRICFALANNYGFPRCIRTCSPSYNDIRNAIQKGLASVNVPSVIASVLAATLAAILIGSLPVLAV
jgi:hypothetical protein